MEEPEIRVEHREMLSELLSEAAEIEHGLMCCYLYAAFSIGGPTQSRQPPSRREALARWRASIMSVARDEMAHLAIVSNLANAIGVSPHFRRANFPVSPGYHPAGVVLSLSPFSLSTIEHFIYLERPEGVEVPDGADFSRPSQYVRGVAAGRLVPNAADYATVGHLYRGLRAGLAHVAEEIGESALFSGSPALQVGPPAVMLPGLATVRDLASAQRAIDTILAQGEGTREGGDSSHYAAFSRIRDELREISSEDPSFDPAGDIAKSPVMRPPPIPEGKIWVTEEPAASVLDVGNALYFAMLRGLEMAFSPVAFDPVARGLALELSVEGMRAMTPIAELLTDLPANRARPGVRAGITFTMSRTLHGQAEGRGALRSASELVRGIAKGISNHVVPLDASLSALATRMGSLGDRLSAAADDAALAIPDAPARTKRALPVASAPVAPVEYAPGEIEEARGEKMVILYSGKRCIHSRHCVLSAPGVFLANVKGPWLHPDEASVETLVTVAHDCPSGAITYRRLDGGKEEEAPPINVLRIRENGPYAVHADIRLSGQGQQFRATLCRCGASKNKPYCDGSHHDIPFVATGEPPTIESEPLADRGGPFEIAPQEDGPLVVSGPIEICAGTGRTVSRTTTARLCRCGGSANKPFCDGTHTRNGFRAPRV